MKKKLYSLVAIVALATNIGFAQKYGDTPQDSIDCIMNYSIYNELYKQNSYVESYETWSNMMKVCPARHINDYIKGRTILKAMIDQAKTPADKERYIGELLTLSDQRSTYFGDEANNIAQKARDISDFYPEKEAEIYNLYKQAAEKDGATLDARYAPLYLQSTLHYIKSTGDVENLSLLFDVYDYASELIDNALISIEQEIEQTEAAKKNTVTLQRTKEEIQSYATMCENYIEPYASCERILPIYQSKYDANPQDLNLLRKITTTLERKGCTESPLFFAATKSLHQIDPSAKTAYMMGVMLIGEKKFSEAAKFLEEALGSYKDNISRSRAAQALARAYEGANQYANARTAANKWGELDKTSEGKAALFVAKLYLSSVVSCASHEGKIRGAAWVAYDEASRIKNNYPELADEAQKVMNSAYSQFPAKKDIFFVGLTEGNSFSVGCWIGRTTTIRGR
ncbi:MAG: hypothetical protein LBO06_01995 [Bacteroidales bacterium]|jgi:Sec-independent protein translocase protein TatA|nr:hypothetical protein [Bacteroidales bacterium]